MRSGGNKGGRNSSVVKHSVKLNREFSAKLNIISEEINIVLKIKMIVMIIIMINFVDADVE